MQPYSTPLKVRVITAEEHRAWVARQSSVSFLQLPEWGAVKREWRAQSLGWFLPADDGERLVGAGLVLYRPVPRFPSRSLAYLPEGPGIDWLAERMPDLTIEQWLQPLLDHCRREGAFQVKLGPPVTSRRWEAETVKRLLAERADGVPHAPARLGLSLADWHDHRAALVHDRLTAMGWRQGTSDGGGFGDVQPRYVFQLPFLDRTLDEILGGFNQLWRRNIRRAEKAGVVVRKGDASDLAAFHEVYLETASRDRFTPRPRSYFERMWTELNRHEERLAIYLADVPGPEGTTHVGSAALMVTVGRHAWYSYGASTTADRDVRPSNAMQWRMITDAHAAGCTVYDLRGISDTLDPHDPLIGLVQFKVGTGGRVSENLGEWDFVLRRWWARAFALYQARRSA